jgi:glutamate dehydrogenase/leucine dehydrogenase
LQGFGNVSVAFAEAIVELLPNIKLIAVTDSKSGVYDAGGLDVERLMSFKKAHGTFHGFLGAKPITNAQLLELNVDILVPAALGDVITPQNMKKVRAQTIVELANGPVTDKAHGYLVKQGKQIVPDIIANAGGVVVSYLEWLQNKQSEHWTLNRVNTELERYMVKATRQMLETAKKEKSSLKDAAFSIALKRLISLA